VAGDLMAFLEQVDRLNDFNGSKWSFGGQLIYIPMVCDALLFSRC